ncbi:Retrovirus-related Pol polyprotein from transposon 17.6 [Labeo rohita]|uniref:Gypsy retrotransposon integrase-like protein 1 n=1 Tax=Labeo rohita TaxID=84645 RepID=A0ABQ8L2V8_LABRO|nr:Retrovirus-related Pol polyprotein from transposon 17.6 [Labeo rohita]
MSGTYGKIDNKVDFDFDFEEYLVMNGVLYVQTNDVMRLVVPSCYRPLVLHLAHTVPWAGHLGQQKTYSRISSRFYWPTLYTDVQTHCNTCAICQKTSPVSQRGRAPLQPLPVISAPFRRIAVDIVGPLEKSSAGHRYILVVSDYATRYPEAFPLRSITTPKIIHALVQHFSRVGIPEEILTDQGTNFTSRLMGQLNKQLGITAIRTTPYHPHTGRDWDKWLPGTPSFNRILAIRAPLWMAGTRTSRPAEEKLGGETCIQDGGERHVLEMQDRLERYREQAKENLQEKQQAQKRWYDQHARLRQFQPGQKVLLLLPTSTSKLLAKWQGPYTVVRKMGPVTYEVHHPDKGKTRETYHVNLLKEWKVPPGKEPETSLLVRKVEVEEESENAKRQSSVVSLTHLEDSKREELQHLLNEFPALFCQRPGRTELAQHTIHLSDPSRQHPYRVPERLVEPLKEKIKMMKDLGVIEPSTSEWSSPIVIVPKKDGFLRVCIDFRKLNAQSKFDAYPMPRVDDLLEKIGKARYITTLDLCKGYWQVPLNPESRPYTAFRTPLGLFQFTVLPLGLHRAPATFQRLMDRVLQGCEDWSAAYMDDVVIHSNSWAEHLQHLQQTLKRIQEAGLTLNVAKCEWARQEANYLGDHLGNGQLRPQMDKVEAIRRSPQPKTKKEVRSFLGLVGWYRRFVPNFASIAAPLANLLSKTVTNPIPWTDDCETAFNALKDKMYSSPVLQSPDFSQRFLVQVDASTAGIGAVLAQGSTGEERPVVYLSCKLLPRETRYSVIEKEGLAIKCSLDSLRYYLLGREFDLETDHRALTWIQSMKDHNARPYRFKIRHRPGRLNVVADYLSRFPASTRLGEGEGVEPNPNTVFGRPGSRKEMKGGPSDI